MPPVAGYDGSSSPILSSVKQLSSRSMSSSKSLEDLTSQASKICISLDSAPVLLNTGYQKDVHCPCMMCAGSE